VIALIGHFWLWTQLRHRLRIGKLRLLLFQPENDPTLPQRSRTFQTEFTSTGPIDISRVAGQFCRDLFRRAHHCSKMNKSLSTK
jgi:hypothetical protein